MNLSADDLADEPRPPHERTREHLLGDVRRCFRGACSIRDAVKALELEAKVRGWMVAAPTETREDQDHVAAARALSSELARLAARAGTNGASRAGSSGNGSGAPS